MSFFSDHELKKASKMLYRIEGEDLSQPRNHVKYRTTKGEIYDSKKCADYRQAEINRDADNPQTVEEAAKAYLTSHYMGKPKNEEELINMAKFGADWQKEQDQ